MTPGGDDERALIARAQGGDARAFEELVRRHADRLHDAVRRWGLDEADAQDVAQETFVRAWRSLPGFRVQSQFYTWLYRIGFNETQRRLARRPPAEAVHPGAQDAQLRELDRRLDDLASRGVEVIAVSAESEEHTSQIQREWKLDRLALAYGLTEEQMRAWGLFVSRGTAEGEPALFSEPALFLIEPDGSVYYESIPLDARRASPPGQPARRHRPLDREGLPGPRGGLRAGAAISEPVTGIAAVPRHPGREPPARGGQRRAASPYAGSRSVSSSSATELMQ